MGHTGPNWLFFGEQHAATDFYYREEIEELRKDGFLTELDRASSWMGIRVPTMEGCIEITHRCETGRPTWDAYDIA